MSKASRIIFSVIEKALILIEWLLAIRFVLRLLGASQAAWIVRKFYAATLFLVAPFQGIFPAWNLGGGMAVDWVVVSTIVSYAIVYFIVHNVYFHRKKEQSQ